MPGKPKKRTDSRLQQVPAGSGAIAQNRSGRWMGFTIVSVIIAFILVIVGIFYYQQNIAPFRRTVIQVDDNRISMGYFIKRARLAGSDPMGMIQVLTNEQLLKLGVPRYGIRASPQDIDDALIAMAAGDNSTITDSEAKEWYRQQLNTSKLSDAEYRDMVAISVVASRLEAELAKQLPTAAEQVHLNQILVRTSADAEKAKARLEAGENFSDVAREVSLDQAAENGGDVGWIPRGVILPGFEEVAFSLNVGDISDPLPYQIETGNPDAPTEVIYYLMMVSEKDAARELEPDNLQRLRGTVLEKWLAEESTLHRVRWLGLRNNFDSETMAWLNYQLAKK
ncbi:MAG: peptidylprolyl isomerase [Chloroflexi bacterium]|nr:peptidylprolyl isomerase [Chloroflexota bacterium]